MRVVVSLVVVLLVGLGVFMYISPEQDVVVEDEGAEEVVEEKETVEFKAEEGEYRVLTSESRVIWAGKKPLIEGYINSGGLTITSGTVVVAGASSTGSFEIDMNTLTVSETKAKPGQESALEGHLKGEGWFNVEEFPNASFEITSAAPRADVETSFMYDITGELTMKGETGELSFPAKIYQNNNGQLIAEASLEFDRTKWGITAGSGSFFDNLADNVIDDMVALSFMIVAEKDGVMTGSESAGMMVPGAEGEDMVAEETLTPLATDEEKEAMEEGEPIEEPVEE